MIKRKLINSLLVIAALVVVAIFAFSVRIEAQADSVTVFSAQGMTCGACADRIEKAIKAHDGITSVQVDVEQGRVVVSYDSAKVKPVVLAEKVTETGYGCTILQTIPADQYQAGKTEKLAAGKGGCGGGCCAKK